VAFLLCSRGYDNAPAVLAPSLQSHRSSTLVENVTTGDVEQILLRTSAAISGSTPVNVAPKLIESFVIAAAQHLAYFDIAVEVVVESSGMHNSWFLDESQLSGLRALGSPAHANRTLATSVSEVNKIVSYVSQQLQVAEEHDTVCQRWFKESGRSFASAKPGADYGYLSWVLRPSVLDFPVQFFDFLKSVSTSVCISCNRKPATLAVCLLCGSRLCATSGCPVADDAGVGGCTHHSSERHAGVGMYLLLPDTVVILLFGEFSVSLGRLYTDRHSSGGHVGSEVRSAPFTIVARAVTLLVVLTLFFRMKNSTVVVEQGFAASTQGTRPRQRHWSKSCSSSRDGKSLLSVVVLVDLYWCREF